ncbi:MAG TPA: hypothetical protein VFR37_04015 [Longimicrobium sp.]|nr:hypothetical protein [Longimicrobium sp.]
MKKLTLDLDALEVVSFDTSRPAKDNGTVRGYEWAWSDDSVCPTVSPSRPPLY